MVGGAVYNLGLVSNCLIFSVSSVENVLYRSQRAFLSGVAAIFRLHVWPPVQHGIHAGGEMDRFRRRAGFGIFGFINRLLIPAGLHPGTGHHRTVPD